MLRNYVNLRTFFTPQKLACRKKLTISMSVPVRTAQRIVRVIHEMITKKIIHEHDLGHRLLVSNLILALFLVGSSTQVSSIWNGNFYWRMNRKMSLLIPLQVSRKSNFM